MTYAVAILDSRGNPCWLTTGEGDPPRTYTAKFANRYKTIATAKAAAIRAEKKCFNRKFVILLHPLQLP